MAQIIPFSSRQAFGRKPPPAGKSAEILRTIYAPARVREQSLTGPVAIYTINRTGQKVRLTEPMTDLEMARKKLTAYQLRAEPDVQIFLDNV